MKWKNAVFSALLSGAGLLLPQGLSAGCLPDSLAADPVAADAPLQAQEIESVYQRRMDKRVHRWQRLIPSHYKAQFAGSIGAGAVGLGWTYGRHDQWETDLLLGFLPKANSDQVRVVFTVKESYIPWNIRLGHSDFTFKPITCGLFFSSVLDNQFWVSEPDRYPKGYYGFSTRIRTNICLGQRFSYYFPEHARTYARGLSVYYELGTCDTDLLLFFSDRCIPFRDILSLGLGVKVHL